MSDVGMKKHKAHIEYTLQDGTWVPGVTTIVSVMDKGMGLLWWAWKLGKQNINLAKHKDALADAGTLAHYKIIQDLLGQPLDQSYLDEFSKVDHDRSDTGFLKYLDWRKQHQIEVVLAETPLVSEKYRFGGTPDVLAVIDGILTLVDVKTCKALYGETDEKWTQVAGYHLALLEAGYEPKAHYILRVGRSEEEGFEYAELKKLQIHIERFLTCRRLYELNKKLEGKAA